MSVDSEMLCSFQILKPSEKKPKYAGSKSTDRRVSRIICAVC